MMKYATRIRSDTALCNQTLAQNKTDAAELLRPKPNYIRYQWNGLKYMSLVISNSVFF